MHLSHINSAQANSDKINQLFSIKYSAFLSFCSALSTIQQLSESCQFLMSRPECSNMMFVYWLLNAQIIIKDIFHSHAKAQRSRNIRLPVGAIKHEDAHKTTEKHPVRVSAQLNSYTCAQNHKHCSRETHKTTGKPIRKIFHYNRLVVLMNSFIFFSFQNFLMLVISC